MADEEAAALVAKAEKKLKGGMFGALFGGGNKEAAVELLEEAANKYKQVKKWSKCGECHERAAQLQLELNDKFGAANCFQAAFQALKKDSESIPAAVECLNQAIQLHLNNGRFTQAAKFHKEAAELYEAELNPEKAVIHYQQAGDYYKELEEYEKAVDIFEAVAASSLDVALLKWSVKDYFFQAGLCRLAIGDMLAAKRAIDRYRDQDVAFADTRECKLLEALCEAYDDQDVEKFTDAVYEFDQISKLDKWKTSVLLRVKNALKESDLT